MRHVEIARAASAAGQARKDIARRLTGRFYTPAILVDRLIDQVTATGPENPPASIGDPFCGDGRLITAWLRRAAGSGLLSRLSRIVIWDYDESALREARQRISARLIELGLAARVTLDAQAGDTFERAPTQAQTLDLILTNPPWELLKPDARDGAFSAPRWKDALREYAAHLAQNFPGAQSLRGKAVAGYGVNLARAGAIAACILSRPAATVALVLPSSLFADQASAPFRREIFSRLRVTQLDFYPAEARLFSGVDQPLVTLIGQAGAATKRYRLVRFSAELEPIETRDIDVDDSRAQPVALSLSGDAATLAGKLAQHHAPLDALEKLPQLRLWLGRELDETRLGEALTTESEGTPFLKGRHVFPFTIVRSEIQYIDPQKRKIPATVQRARLAWRDVSRPTQKRRMHVALVPPGNVTGNSLGVALFREAPAEYVTLLMAIMNSLVFELQVRANLATAHVSQGVLRRCTVPLRCFDHPDTRDRLFYLVSQRMSTGHESPQLEALIARQYELTRDDFSSVLATFVKLDEAAKQDCLRCFDALG